MIQQPTPKPAFSPFVASTPLLLCASLCLTLTALSFTPNEVMAQTGVDDDRVSLPEGPGSLEGVGENVDVDPNMGLMSYSVPMVAPKGFPGMEPGLSLSYSSGSGSGMLGVGWSMGTSSIERMTSKGVPRYDTEDFFAANGGEELVKVSEAGGDAVYRARFEKGFVRYTFIDAGADGYWIAEYPDGRKGYFGADADGQTVATARTTNPDGGTYRYHLVDMTDQYGHKLHYTYDTFGGNYPLLTEVGYVYVDDAPTYRARLDYETRGDLISDCGAGFNEVLGHRLSLVTMFAGTSIVRSYELEYVDAATSGGASQLARVRQWGVGGRDGGELYPIAWSFGYSRGLGATCGVGDESCERPFLVDMGTLPGAVNLGAGNATLIDINGDALPDVLDTSGVGPHRFFLNTLTPDGDGFSHGFSDAVESAVSNGSAFQLDSQNVQTFDINGDGFSDLVNTTTGGHLLGGGQGRTDWASATQTIDAGALPDFNGNAFAQLRFFDGDNDKRIDLIQATSSETRIYRNGEDGFEAQLVDHIEVGFETSNLQLSDMNGDGMNDPVEILSGGSVRYRLNYGRGKWSGWISVTGVDVAPSEQDLVDLEDLNGDGLSDIVVVTTNEIKYALNQNGASFAPFVTITSADIDGEIPERVPGVSVLYSDMNGNASEDVVWFDQNGGVRYLELFPVRPNLISTITNGIGMVQKVTYGSSVEHQARAVAAGEPWNVTLPNAMLVVDKIDLYNTLTGEDDGTGVHDVTTYSYRDGFYDGIEKQFRGFTDVTSTLVGDTDQEMGTTRMRYDAGVTDPYRNGLLLRRTSTSEDRTLADVTITYDECDLDGLPAGLEVEVRHICEVEQRTVVMEGAQESAWLTLSMEKTWDGYGNVTLDANLGVVERGGQPCGAECMGDELYNETSFVPPSGTNGLWMLRQPMVSQSYTDPADPFRTEVRYYYDGPDFEGLPAGELTHGFLSRQTTRISPDSDEVIQAVRARRDAHGNTIESLDPLGDPGELNAHRRRSTYDATGTLLAQADIMLISPEGAPYQLRKEYRYESSFQKLSEATDHMIVIDGAVVSPRNSRRFRYDDFGRLIARLEPGDDNATPSKTFTYELADPVSRVVFETRSAQNGALDEVAYRCFDGQGRMVQERIQTASGQYQVSGFSAFNNRGAVVEKFQPFTSPSADCDMTPPTDVASTRTRYDAAFRVREVTMPDGDIYGTESVVRTDYMPLQTIAFDPEDSDPASPHADTPTVRWSDGLERPIAIERAIARGGNVEMARYEFAYDNLGNMAQTTDPEGNVHLQTFDLLGRVTVVDSPDSGEMTMTYDAASNLVAKTDARGVTVRSAFDGANRKVAEYEEGARETSESTWRFDMDPDCELTECTNLQGRLASVRYPLSAPGVPYTSGMERLGYDVRGRPIFVGRTLGEVDLAVTTTYDNRDRPTTLRYPDDTEVRYTYDAAGRVTAIPGYADALTYEPRGMIAGIDYDNGASQTFAWDDVQRLSGVAHADASGADILAMSYTRDRVGNVTAMTHIGPAQPGQLRAQTLTYDDWYRPITADLTLAADGAEAINEAITSVYSDLGQILSRASSLAGSPSHVGDYTYGDEKPRAATQAGTRALSYDAAGLMTTRDAGAQTWDFLGRLTSATRGDARLDALYGPDQIRVAKIDDGALTLYGPSGFEVRNGVATTYVRHKRRFIARHQDPSFANKVYPDLAPGQLDGAAYTPAPDDDINVADAWAAYALGEGILQGDAPDMDAALVLSAAAARVLAEEEDAKTFLHTDHLDSVLSATDEGGQERGQRSYDLFGVERWSRGFVDPYGFTAQETDEATGLIRFQFRYFDAHIGRWISPDPAFGTLSAGALSNLAEATGAYSYVANNPLTLFDPLGLKTSKSEKKAAKKAKKTSKKAAKAEKKANKPQKKPSSGDTLINIVANDHLVADSSGAKFAKSTTALVAIATVLGAGAGIAAIAATGGFDSPSLDSDEDAVGEDDTGADQEIFTLSNESSTGESDLPVPLDQESTPLSEESGESPSTPCVGGGGGGGGEAGIFISSCN